MEKSGQGAAPYARRAAEPITRVVDFFQETKATKNYLARSCSELAQQPFEKARFVEGDNLDFPSTRFDFPSPGLDFPSLSLGFSFRGLWKIFPPGARGSPVTELQTRATNGLKTLARAQTGA
jgi:hypothetical protein